MNIRIQQYQLLPTKGTFQGPVVVEMPFEAELLDATFLNGEPTIWAKHHLEHEKTLTERVFHVFVTGEAIEVHHKVKYFRTIQHPHVPLLWHIFYEAW